MIQRLVLLMLSTAMLLSLHAARARAGTDSEDTLYVHVTTYLPTGQPTYSGEMPYDGSAGCSRDIPLGTELALPDRVVTCDDRGDDAALAPHVDVFCAYSLDYCIRTIAGAGNWHVPELAHVLRWGW